MRAKYITNACFLFEFSDGMTILSDPWLSDGIYHGLIFNYPPIGPELKSGYLELRPDYIYISHLHSDHLDAMTLKHFDKKTPIIVGKFSTPAMFLSLKSLGFENIIEIEFGVTTLLGQHEVRIYSQFSGSSDDLINDSGVDVDTSIFLQDVDGQKCFFAVDNPMQERHADMIRKEHGVVDLAILPYTGASVYPFIYKNYSPEEKRKRMLALRKAKLDKFVQLSKTIMARRIVPAAGSFVLGGKGACHAPFQPQPTPRQITEHWQSSGMDADQLCMLSTGDSVELGALKVELEPLTKGVDRDYSEEDRVAYAASIAQFSCDLDLVQWPAALRLPWKSLLNRARKNMWAYQNKSVCKPESDVYLIIKSSAQVPFPQEEEMRVKIAMDNEKLDFPLSSYSTDRPYTEFYFSANVLLALMLGATYWNVAEYHMQSYRNPDKFDPTIRSLLTFFKL
ncbi:MBL fold metallo-hydrolase [Castellaniella sp.]|uniref:MBL fold metallo-hydrolase n=1 Tax=Castellaniella sp. TaxID=1955812 RepID=UPI002AFE2D0B|nr:MBL fold metallo-hydrolase [Castellaniella sp.]